MTILQSILDLFSTQFEKACAYNLMVNEIMTGDEATIISTACKLSFAGASSGYSFGFNQMDLAIDQIKLTIKTTNSIDNKSCLEDKPCIEGNNINQLKVA